MTVQNTKLSGYNPNRQPSSMPSYLGLPRISGWKKFANLFEPDSPNKLKCDCLCTGRSMVEMLGVLAIVGVLSVGAIAGYSKAMTKYKLNKQAESFNAFINNAIKIKPDLERAFKGSAFYTSFFYKAGLIPDGMEYDKSIDRIRDVFNNYTMIYYSTSLGYDYIDYVSITTLQRSGRKLTSRDREICNNMVTVAKENAANLATLELRSHSCNESPYTYKRLTGDIYAGSDHGKLLRSVTLKDIDEFCASCDSEKSCELIIYYK